MTRKLVYYCLLLTTFLHFSIATQAQEDYSERIISFHSDINIDTTGLMKVTEHIKVYASRDQIKRGIVRTIPLYRTDKYGNNQYIDFEILSITKNGKKENFFTKEVSSNRSIYMGDKDVELSPGIYEYLISYQTRGHVGFFDGYDELYWNVTGNEWAFPIEAASASIHFPPGTKAGNTSCYTGSAGATTQDCNITNNPDGSVTFKANTFLPQNQGFTIAAAFTAGVIKRPSFAERLSTEYRFIIIPLLLLIALAGYYYYSWNKYGRDPKKPLVIPSFKIPGDYAPAVLRYIYKKKIDPKGFAISIINMAVKRVIKISKGPDKEDDYVLERISEKQKELSSEEQAIYKSLLNTKKSIKVNESSGSAFNQARRTHSAKIKEEIALKNYFLSHTKQLVFASVVTLAALIVFMVFVDAAHPAILLFFTPFIAAGTFCIYVGLKNLFATYGISILLVAFGAGFTGMPTYILFTQVHNVPLGTIIFLFSIAIMFTTYVILIKAPTTQGAVLLSEIEGFKMYLETAEQHRLNLINPPELTPQLFEKFLPYAMALDVENAWGAKFEEILNGLDYQPGWYAGDQLPYRALGVAMAQPFSKALADSRPVSTSSGSSSGSSGSSSWSSGSSGGGSSGGGGGGGGGGGW